MKREGKGTTEPNSALGGDQGLNSGNPQATERLNGKEKGMKKGKGTTKPKADPGGDRGKPLESPQATERLLATDMSPSLARNLLKEHGVQARISPSGKIFYQEADEEKVREVFPIDPGDREIIVYLNAQGEAVPKEEATHVRLVIYEDGKRTEVYGELAPEEED